MPRKPRLTKAQIAARKRLLEDFAFYAKHCIRIRTKDQGVQPLLLNRVQQRFVKRIIEQEEHTGQVRFVVLKARQQGLSTVISAWNYFKVSQAKGQKATVVAHVKDSSQTLFDMYKRAHEHMPDLLKPSTRYSSRREIVFDQLDSSISVATAGGENPLRGEALQYMHLSEVAFWPANFAKQNFNGMIKALPPHSGACFVESTANGMTGEFYHLWQGAVAGTNGFEPFFSAWFESEEYALDPPHTLERTPDEQTLIARYGLTDAQLYWRRREIARDGIEHFKQEYPSTAEEAFITSGRPVFHAELLHEWKQQAPVPIRRMAVEQGVDSKGREAWKVVDDPRGELRVYHERRPNEQYFVGADVGVGIRDPEKSDYCVACVLDSHKRQVAVWREQVTPDHYARVLHTLGLYYNIALVAPERNGHGLLVCVRLHKDLSYPNVYTDLKEGQLADRETLDIGWQTNVGSRPLIIDKLRGEVRERQIEVNDLTTLDEMLSFIVTESGKMQAEQGCYDDCVFALAIANHIHEGRFSPVEVGDEFYSEAV